MDTQTEHERGWESGYSAAIHDATVEGSRAHHALAEKLARIKRLAELDDMAANQSGLTPDENEERDSLREPLADTEPQMILVLGNPMDGIRFVGPFADGVEANQYADERYHGDEWWAASIDPPDGCADAEHDWEACEKCVTQAVEDGILSPGSRPHGWTVSG